MTSEQILRCLIAGYHARPGEWILIPELRTGIGYGWQSMKFVDLFAFKIWAGGRYSKFDRIAYEIKTSLSDFNKEIADPSKRLPAMGAATYFYFVAPRDVIPLEKVPPECGLIEIRGKRQGSLFYKDAPVRLRPRIVIPAPRNVSEPTWNFCASMLRAVQQNKQIETKKSPGNL